MDWIPTKKILFTEKNITFSILGLKMPPMPEKPPLFFKLDDFFLAKYL